MSKRGWRLSVSTISFRWLSSSCCQAISATTLWPREFQARAGCANAWIANPAKQIRLASVLLAAIRVAINAYLASRATVAEFFGRSVGQSRCSEIEHGQLRHVG